MFAPGLVRGIAILRLFRRRRTVLTPPQIAAELSIPRTTVHRLLSDLCDLGLVRREADGRFALDAGVLGLGFEYLASMDIVGVASPILETVRNETNWSTHLAIRQGRSITYLARFPGRTAVTRNITVGASLPAHATLMGRLLLSDLEPIALRRLYAGVDLEYASAQTPRDLAALEQLIAGDRERGHIISDGFYEAGVRVVAAPVRDGALKVVGAINATALEGDGADIETVTAAILDAAERMSRLLGAPAGVQDPAAVKIGESTWL